MKFTLPQLKEEFYAKNLYGLIFTQLLIPAVIREQDEVPDMDNYDENTMKEAKERMESMVENNPLLKPRMLSVFDEMIESGCIPTEL